MEHSLRRRCTLESRNEWGSIRGANSLHMAKPSIQAQDVSLALIGVDAADFELVDCGSDVVQFLFGCPYTSCPKPDTRYDLGLTSCQNHALLRRKLETVISQSLADQLHH